MRISDWSSDVCSSDLGTIGGKATFDMHGNSVAAMLGDGDGSLKLFMSGGDISALLVDLAGLDLGNSLLSALGLPRRAAMRCMMVDTGLNAGPGKSSTLLLAMSTATLRRSGSLALDQEQDD